MTFARRWWCLTVLLGMLTGTQQFLFWSRHHAAKSRLAAQQASVVSSRVESERLQLALLQSGRMWAGQLHAHSESSPQHVPSRVVEPTLRRRIFGQIRLNESKPPIIAELEMHECDPGSQACTTGGNITLLDGDRVLCRITVGLLKTQGEPSEYQVHWPIDRLDAEENHALMKRLSGEAPPPDRDTFHRLMQAAYAGTSNNSREAATSHKVAIVRAILRAICVSRTQSSGDADS